MNTDQSEANETRTPRIATSLELVEAECGETDVAKPKQQGSINTKQSLYYDCAPKKTATLNSDIVI